MLFNGKLREVIVGPKKPLSILAGVLGVVAAALWFWAAKTQPLKPASMIIDCGDIDHPASGGIFYDEDFMSSSARASKLNAWAAVATGLSVLLSTIGSMANL